MQINDAQETYVTGCYLDQTNLSGYTTLKYDSNGNQLWFETYSGVLQNSDPEKPTNIKLDSDGNIYVAGYIGSDSTFSYDYAILKYDPQGNQLWMETYNGSGNGTDIITKMILDNLNNVYVTGYSYTGADRDYDYLTIKYSQPVGIENNTSTVSNAIRLENNFPNPFNPKTKIKYSLIKQEYVSLKVYNSLGILVDDLVHGKENAGEHSIVFDGGKLASGIYFYKLEVDGNAIDTKKMVLLK